MAEDACVENSAADPPYDPKPQKRRWWPWVIGFLLLLAFCDDDDDRPRQYCYEFSNGETRCFAQPLPEDQRCYIVDETSVRCVPNSQFPLSSQ